ncbi:diguanylate cyclase [Neptunomonas concharum]|uniref:diguanylate cyclase n=1 Tax=Neptunomonas concharum TaxID=1031538 RepID=A0A5P1R6R7_9GAMM|nr:diguanylate cyclase [Neptunomonas concharum]QEQ95347.1 diguanylate cyclase [Neptunomonas concharum]
MKVLVVEDSQVVLKIVKHLFNRSNLPLQPVFCETMQAAQQVIDQSNDIFVALVDLNLPDAPKGEIVDLTLAQGIPTVVLSATYDDTRREALLTQGVVDYIVKESRFSYEFALQLVGRLLKNQHIKILVAEDSLAYRKLVRRQLERHLYQVIEAEDGVAALAALKANPEIKLLLTDYEMPNMDGVKLVQNIRREYETTDLKIIGLSAADKPALSAQFIKNGANDFLRKPFNYEELHCRVMHNLEQIELIQEVRLAAYSDYLTGLPNRRSLFEEVEKHFHDLKLNACVAIMDLDLFKRINDQYGHDAGDLVLKQFGQMLRQAFSRFSFARIGGEEFCVVLEHLSGSQAEQLMSRFCELVDNTDFIFHEERIPVTVSIGVACRDQDSFTQVMSRADDQLYRAKELGRNQVVIE